jgi:hypothetical protein
MFMDSTEKIKCQIGRKAAQREKDSKTKNKKTLPKGRKKTRKKQNEKQKIHSARREFLNCLIVNVL